MYGFHHLRARVKHPKTSPKSLVPFPATSLLKRRLDYLMYVVGVTAPLALLPQVVTLYVSRTADDFSLVSWILLTTQSALWVAYGYVHKEPQLVIANGLFMFLNLAIVTAILIF